MNKLTHGHAVAALALLTGTALGDDAVVGFRHEPGQLHVLVGDEPVAAYVYEDDTITRPYFAHLRPPGGPQVTRNHPPRAGDLDDHAKMHPGLWLAFGDISGNDYWRLKTRVKHDRFTEEPWSETGRGGFAVRNSYLGADGDRTVCVEDLRCTLLTRPEGLLILWDSTFGGGEFCFGDQEEMGLGVRLATQIAEKSGRGGRILDSEGRQGAADVWGSQAVWCDYSGEIGGQPAGIMLMSHPSNFRRCWWHARDYGLLLANPFGRAAFTEEPPSEVLVREGESLRLRFGVLLHVESGGERVHLAAAYDHYLEAARED